MQDASRMEIACPLRSGAREARDEPALIAPDRSFTFLELDRCVSAAAAQLRGRGLEGRRLALLLESDLSLIVIMLAAIRARVVACPLSTRLPSAAVALRLKEINASAIVTDREDVNGALHPTEILPTESKPAERDDIAIRADQPATIIFTSGSAGRPRGVLHTFGNHYFNAAGSNENIPLEPGHRWLLSLPLYHVGGLAILFRCLLGRAAVVVPHIDEPQVDQISSVTHASMVATQLKRLLEKSTDTDLRALLVGGSAIPHSLIAEAHHRGLPIYTTYGLTEMGSQVATTAPGASLEALQSSGRVLPYRDLRIDEFGEIHVRGETRFEGYVDEDDIERPFDPGGWFRTGDLGRIDDQKRLYVTGRKDNMFVSGGENIQPEEIEKAITSLTDVRRAVVVPILNDEYGRRPVAFVDRTPAGPTDTSIRELLEAHLPKFMIPDAFYAWPEASEEGMKIDRETFRQEAERIHR